MEIGGSWHPVTIKDPKQKHEFCVVVPSEQRAASYQWVIHLMSKWNSPVAYVFDKIAGPRTEVGMDTPIKIQQGTGDIFDEPAAALFQRQWQLYRRFAHNNYFYHHEVYTRLHRILVDEAIHAFRFLDIACGDARASVDALRGTGQWLFPLENGPCALSCSERD